MTELAGVE